MWNDTDTPIAYFITFSTYGNWLHGDKRGSINRYRNIYGTKYLPHDDKWVQANKHKLRQEPVKLNARQRTVIEQAIVACCLFRKWNLIAINVRTNHVHVVVDIGEQSSSRALNALKANATREMREKGVWTSDLSPWSERGSKRPLWNEKSVTLTVNYVLFGQGEDLPRVFE